MKAAHFTTLVIMAMTVASCATLGPVGCQSLWKTSGGDSLCSMNAGIRDIG